MENSAVHVEAEVLALAPGSLIHLVDNSLSSPVLNQILLVKGVYKKGKGVNYNGLYYDILKDAFGEANITLVVHESIRPKLKDGQLVETESYLTKRVAPTTGRIDLLLRLSDLRNQMVIEQNPADQLALDLIRKKAAVGYRDLSNLIRERIFQQSPISINILVGTTAIVDQDVLRQLRESVQVYTIKFIRVNLTRPQDIMDALKAHDNGDILVVTRGGGEHLHVFDNEELAALAISLQSILVSAIGHAVDEPLFQKVSDRSFITPTALGQYLYDLYQSYVEDIQRSKAKLIDDITKQVEVTYQHQIRSLTAQLTETNLQAQTIHDAERSRNEKLSATLGQQRSRNSVIITILIILLVILSVLLLVK